MSKLKHLMARISSQPKNHNLKPSLKRGRINRILMSLSSLLFLKNIVGVILRSI
jgi:hypothetical protein